MHMHINVYSSDTFGKEYEYIEVFIRKIWWKIWIIGKVKEQGMYYKMNTLKGNIFIYKNIKK